MTYSFKKEKRETKFIENEIKCHFFPQWNAEKRCFGEISSSIQENDIVFEPKIV